MEKSYQIHSISSTLSTLHPNGKKRKTPTYQLPTCAALMSDLFFLCPPSCLDCPAAGGITKC